MSGRKEFTAYYIMRDYVIIQQWMCGSPARRWGRRWNNRIFKGRIETLEEASIDRIWESAQKAVQELEFITTSKQKDAFSAELITHGANDKRIEIDL